MYNTATIFNVTTTLNNATFNNTIQLQVPMAANTSYVPNSVSAVVTNGTQNGLSFDAGANRLVWIGNLAPASITVSNSSTTIEDISPTGNNTGTKATCSATCDDTSFSSNLTSVGGFLYNGQVYTTLQYTSNGVAFAGTQSGASTGVNQQLPSSVAPNNALAAFWTDLDLLGTAVGDLGAGNIYNKTAVEGDGFTYRTIQWDKVALYGDTSGTLYTFQLKIRLGGTSESVRFNYISIPNMPAAVTVGAEDAAGKIGVSRYFNGTGTAVSNGQSLLVNTVVGGKVVLTHNAKSSALNLGSDRLVTLDEDTSANVNVLGMLNPSELKLLKAKVLHQANGAELNAVNTLAVGPNGSVDPASITLTTAPAHGVAVVATDGSLAYTPSANFAGTDSAVVSFKDSAGNDISRVNLSFNVVGINEAPTVSAGADKTANGNAVVILTGTAGDIDGDTLSYRWTQVSGTTANMINPTSAEMRFSAPNKTESLVFRLTVSDPGG